MVYSLPKGEFRIYKGVDNTAFSMVSGSYADSEAYDAGKYKTDRSGD